jgi:hypothetical protein
MKFDITYGPDYKLDIILSKGTGEYNIEEPIKIDPKKVSIVITNVNRANICC